MRDKNFESFLQSRKVMSTKQYEKKFNCDLYDEGKKVSVYLDGYYILHTGHKFLVTYDRTSILFNSRKEAEKHFFENFVSNEHQF